MSKALEDSNPYRAPGAETVALSKPAPAQTAYFEACSILLLLAILASAAMCLADVESILWSGPTVTVLGLLSMATLRQRSEFPLAVIYGLSGPLLSVCVGVLINVRGWSPADAQVPVSLISLVYAVVATPLAVFVLRHTRRTRPR